MSSLSYGFDTQAFNGIQALATFKNQFGEPEGPRGAKVNTTLHHILSMFDVLTLIPFRSYLPGTCGAMLLVLLTTHLVAGICLPSIP